MSFRKKLILLLPALLFSIAAHAEPKVAVDTVVVIVEEVGPVHAHPPKAPERGACKPRLGGGLVRVKPVEGDRLTCTGDSLDLE